VEFGEKWHALQALMEAWGGRGGQYLELPTSPRPAPASKYECPRIGRVAQSRDRAA